MYKLNFISIAVIVAAVSLAVGMASPAAFATLIMTEETGLMDNTTTTMGNNMSSMGNMTGGGGNATSMAETESLPSAGETGESGPCDPMCCHGDNPQC